MAPEHQGMTFVPNELRKKAELYEQRNKLYGDNYKRFGAIMALLFPNGLHLKTVDDFNRMGVLVQKMSKVTRYAENFATGGHDDSLDDLAVYSMMLKELDTEARAEPQDAIMTLPRDVAEFVNMLTVEGVRAMRDSLIVNVSEGKMVSFQTAELPPFDDSLERLVPRIVADGAASWVDPEDAGSGQ